MENKYYTVKDIQIITGCTEINAYQIIQELNKEIEIKYKQYQPSTFKDRVSQDYFMKRMEMNL